MLKKLNIPYHPSKDSIEKFSELLNSQEKNEINCLLWDSKFSGKVYFTICHNGETLFIKFFVIEKDVIAKHTHINDPVYEDSCVEFFIAFDDDTNYYNLEFNSIGTCLAQYGSTFKPDRKLLTVESLQEIKTVSSIKDPNAEGLIEWELTVAIPKQVFAYTQINNFSNKKAKVNFYKCGDDLPEPHFICWNEIKSKELNFHKPEFFGEAVFSSL